MKEITINRVIAWNGGTEQGLAEYLIWALDNPKEAKEEILNYEE